MNSLINIDREFYKGLWSEFVKHAKLCILGDNRKMREEYSGSICAVKQEDIVIHNLILNKFIAIDNFYSMRNMAKQTAIYRYKEIRMPLN